MTHGTNASACGVFSDSDPPPQRDSPSLISRVCVHVCLFWKPTRTLSYSAPVPPYLITQIHPLANSLHSHDNMTGHDAITEEFPYSQYPSFPCNTTSSMRTTKDHQRRSSKWEPSNYTFSGPVINMKYNTELDSWGPVTACPEKKNQDMGRLGIQSSWAKAS